MGPWVALRSGFYRWFHRFGGFDENLDFGLGVNRMTPGQKNVLIFGSLALGFAFFLSLYSLR